VRGCAVVAAPALNEQAFQRGERVLPESDGSEPTPAQLLAVIRTQTEIVKLGLDLSGVMELVAQEVQAITRAAGAVVELAEGDDMVYRAVAGTAAGQLGLRLRRASSLSGLCVHTVRALRCDDAESDPRVNVEACRKVGLRSMVVVPLIHHDQAVGVLKVISPAPSAFGEGDVKVLALMSELIAAATFHAAKYGTDELFRRATRDDLTGLANRALFYDRLRHALAQARRRSQRVGVLMLDMDGLKQINDQHGHRAGDAAIKELARRISADARKSDTAARLGGDEFGLVLSAVEDREGALVASRRIAERVEQPFSFEGVPLRMGASVGVAICPDDSEQPDSLVEIADQAMYVTKRQRKQSGTTSVSADTASGG
jgi:diguanylate cyclase (GGDEF)-like protein